MKASIARKITNELDNRNRKEYLLKLKQEVKALYGNIKEQAMDGRSYAEASFYDQYRTDIINTLTKDGYNVREDGFSGGRYRYRIVW